MKKRLAVFVLLIAVCAALTGCGRGILDEVPNPIATIHMSDGSQMRFELFVQDAPNTVANFVELAQDGFYDGLGFFRVIPGALIQAGSPNNTRKGGAGYTIQGEFADNGIENNISHTRGTISMSRQTGYDTASSQFFILQGNYPQYNNDHSAFGRAVDEASLAVLDKIATVLVDGNYFPVEAMNIIRTITVETGGYDYESAKIDLPEDEEEK